MPVAERRLKSTPAKGFKRRSALEFKLQLAPPMQAKGLNSSGPGSFSKIEMRPPPPAAGLPNVTEPAIISVHETQFIF